MKQITLLMLLLFFKASSIYGQNYEDTVFSIATNSDIAFDTVIDFAGNQRILKLDVSFPTDDTPTNCGRPLMVVVHGGAWITGDKSEANVSRIRTDFAKRGYTTASINYRLGQFNIDQNINCNVQFFGLEWNCLNMGDSTEWYRAYYRGIQDLNSAVRYLVNNASNYNIDPNQIFLVGESAGGFIAMGAGFIDTPSEVPQNQIIAMPAIAAPNAIYESACIQTYNMDTSIASLNLSRPALGSYDVGGNYPLLTNYTVRGVGNIFGGVFNNIFHTSQGVPPALFLFHQPNDLIVPFGFGKVFEGYNDCLNNAPFNCGNIINRPHLSGSNGIVQMIDNISLAGQVAPDYLTNFTTNITPCSTQPGHGHSYDNFWLRTSNMAAYFATKISPCAITGVNQVSTNSPYKVFPNPIHCQTFFIEGNFEQNDFIELINTNGQVVKSIKLIDKSISIHGFDISNLSSGFYVLNISSGKTIYRTKLILQ